MGRITAVCISEKKGTVKKDIGRCLVIKGYGLAHDAHAGSERQVSLLPSESVKRFRERTEGKVSLPAGVFGENILTEGIDYEKCHVGTRLRCGEVLLEIEGDFSVLDYLWLCVAHKIILSYNYLSVNTIIYEVPCFLLKK